MGYGITQEDDRGLPLASVWSPGQTNPVPTQGGLSSADGNGEVSAPVAVAAATLSATLQNAYAGTPTAPYGGTAFAVTGMASVDFTVTGTFSATVLFRGTGDGVTWTNLFAEQIGVNSALSNGATGPGVFRAGCDGLQQVEAYVSQYTSGSLTVTAVASSIAGPARNVNSNIALWNGLVPGNSNPVITEDQIRGYILAGQGFTASSGKVAPSVTASTFGTAIYNPSTSGKNVLIYSIRVFANTNMYGSINQVTADPAFGTTVTGFNLKPGAGNPVVTLDGAASAPSVGVTPAGTTIETTAFSAGQTTELLLNGAVMLLPSGANNGLATYITTSATNQVYITTYRWIEF